MFYKAGKFGFDDCAPIECPEGCLEVKQRGSCAECNCTTTFATAAIDVAKDLQLARLNVPSPPTKILNVPPRCPDMKKCHRDCIRLGFDDCPYCSCGSNASTESGSGDR